ncbi:MAG: hypothetical protein ABI910_18045 [Gemmatimonadota bacterium]
MIVSACSSLTEVNAPDLVQRGALTNANGAVTFFNGAVSSFYGVFGQRSSNFASGSFLANSGLLSDELIATSQYSGMNDPDKHILPEASGSFGTYAYLQRARVNQLQALAVLKQSLPSARWRIGEIYGLLGTLETLMAETMCSGVPLSNIGSDFAPEYGPPLTTTALLEHALAVMDSAVAYSSDSARILNLARVGRGRILLDLGKTAEAGAAVAAVPTSFVFITEHSPSVVPNILADWIILGTYGIANGKGTNGLDYLAANDQRLNAVLVGPGQDKSPVYRPARLSSQASPNIVTNGVEARLIEAEAALKAGDANWLVILNNLRATATAPSMAPLADPGTPAARVDLLFRERAFWLYLTGHRFGDMRRLMRQYGRAYNTVFPVGPYKFGGDFGTDLQFPIDAAEVSSNPLMNNTVCLDRNP